MKEKKKPKFSIIEERDSGRFEEVVNEALSDLFEEDGFRFEVKDPTPDGVFRAFLFWNEKMEVPSDARDFAHLAGVHYTCGQCPYAEFPNDKRVTKSVCPMESLVYRDQDACVLAYKQAAEGKLTMKGAE